MEERQSVIYPSPTMSVRLALSAPLRHLHLHHH